MKRAVLAFAALLLASGFVPAAPAAETEPALVSHAPIVISSNAQFATLAAAEGWPGAGTAANPYIIQGYDIAGSTTAGIWVRSTSVSFTVRNNRIHDAGHGMLLQSVGGSVRIEANAVDNVKSVGIYVLSSTATITGNTVTNPGWTGINTLFGTYTVTGNTVNSAGAIQGGGYGFLIGYGSNSLLSGNTVNGVHGNGVLFSGGNAGTTMSGNTFNGVTGDGIEVAYASSAGSLISGNVVGPGARNGIHVYDSRLVNLQGNAVRGAGIGLFAERTKDSTFAGGDLRGNAEGIRLDTVTATTVRSNRLADNGHDLHLKISNGNLLYDNAFESHAPVWFQLSKDNRWNVDKVAGTNILGGAFLGGNAWWDYTGIDADLDGLGEVPYGMPFGVLPRDTVVEDTYATLMPYGPFDLHPLMSGPVAAGVLARVGV